MAIQGRRILVTGGAGFVASHLIERLVDANEVTIFDNFRRNAIKGTRLPSHPHVHIVRGDVTDAEVLAREAMGHHIFVHAAAIAGVEAVLRDPIATMKVNLLGTYHALEAAARMGRCERFLNFSTSEVFGSHSFRNDEDDFTPMGSVGEPRWTYAVSKVAGEHLAHAYHRQQGLPTVTVRPFNIYGPRQVGEGAIHAFITHALRDEDLLIHGTGEQLRSWCYIDDIVDALMLCLEKPEAVGHCFNLGNPRATVTVHGLAQAIVRVCHSSSRLAFVPRPCVDVELRVPNIDKAREVLGYEPKVELEEGLRRTAEWYGEALTSPGHPPPGHSGR